MTIHETRHFAWDTGYPNEERREPYQNHRKERPRERDVFYDPMPYIEYANKDMMYETFIVNRRQSNVKNVNITHLALKVLVTILLLSLLLFGYYFFVQREQMEIMKGKMQLLEENMKKEFKTIQGINSKLLQQINESRTHIWKETKLIEAEREIKRKTLLTKIEKLGKEFSVQFEVLPKTMNKERRWYNVLHFTNTTENSDTSSARAPAVWFYNAKIYVSFTTRLFKSRKSYRAGDWITVKITQIRDISNYILSCRIGGELVASDVNLDPIDISNITVYLSNNWDEPQHGLVRKLSLFSFEGL